MPIRVYEYKACSTCRKALQFLDRKGIAYEAIPIVERPPSLEELRTVLKVLKQRGESFKALFNVSGQLYREMGLSEKIKNGLSEADAMELLAKNGKLIKRPFLLANRGGAVGFKEDEWRKLLEV